MNRDIPIPASKLNKTITFRIVKSLPCWPLSPSVSPPSQSDDPNELVNYYSLTLSACPDQLIPTKTKTVTHSVYWYNPKLHLMKTRKPQLERLHKKTGQSTDPADLWWQSPPSLWNSLPRSIRHCTDLLSFKAKLKTYLFKIAFNVYLYLL